LSSPEILFDDGRRQKLIEFLDILKINLQREAIWIGQFGGSFQVLLFAILLESRDESALIHIQFSGTHTTHSSRKSENSFWQRKPTSSFTSNRPAWASATSMF